METEDVRGKKVPVKGGGVCIYCGWDGGDQGLHDEHIVPYSLGGNTELLNASCSDCESVTSYLDGYIANAIFGHLRVHMDLQSRSGHPETLPATIELADGIRAIDLTTASHPYFLNLPIWRPPGFMIGKQISEGFGEPGKFTYWYVPPDIKSAIGLTDGEIARVIDTSPPHNLSTFARGLAKIAYCNAVMKYGLDGFRPLVIPDIVLGKYPNIAYFVGSDPRNSALCGTRFNNILRHQISNSNDPFVWRQRCTGQGNALLPCHLRSGRQTQGRRETALTKATSKTVALIVPMLASQC